jgi:hypothetical protein
MNNMAVLLSDQNLFTEAEALYEKVYKSFQANYGEDDGQTKKARFNLTTFLRKKNENFNNEIIRGGDEVLAAVCRDQESDRNDSEGIAPSENFNDGNNDNSDKIEGWYIERKGGNSPDNDGIKITDTDIRNMDIRVTDSSNDNNDNDDSINQNNKDNNDINDGISVSNSKEHSSKEHSSKENSPDKNRVSDNMISNNDLNDKKLSDEIVDYNQLWMDTRPDIRIPDIRIPDTGPSDTRHLDTSQTDTRQVAPKSDPVKVNSFI